MDKGGLILLRNKMSLLKELREKTGAGVLDCKKALEESQQDLKKAIDFLREKGIAGAEKKMGRLAAEGLVDSYIHFGGRIGVLVEVNCETDFVAKTDDFQSFVRDVAMQVAATQPTYVSRDEVPEEVLKREREILTTQALNEGKPAHIAQKMVEGRLNKFYQEECLLEMPFIRDSDITIMDLLRETISRLGENVVIRRFARFALGEEEKKPMEES